jgi:hypothetical protein
MKTDIILSTLMAMGVGSEYFGGYKQSKNSIKSGARHRSQLPEFKKCASCGFEVVYHQLGENQICEDYRGGN